MKCPNKNLPEWKALERAQPDLAHYLWNKHDGKLPSDLLENIMKDEVVNPETGEVEVIPADTAFSTDSIGELQNEYIDIHLKVLTHPEVLHKVLSPLDKKGKFSIEGEADLIHNIRTKDKALSSPLSRGYQQRSFIENRAGKMGVAVLSLTSTFNATIQGKQLRSGEIRKGKFIPRAIEFEGIEMHILSGEGTNPKGSKADVIADMQNAAVDNANEQRLNKVNLNPHTFEAAGALAQLEDAEGKNLDVQYITRLLSQQAVIDFVKEAESLDDSTIEDFVADKKAEAYERVLKKYTDMVSSSENIAKYIDGAQELSPELMLQMIKDEGNPDIKWAGLQIKALETFMQADAIGSDLVTIQGAINADSQGAGKDMLSVADKVGKINGLGGLAIDGTAALLDPETEVGRAVQLGPVLANTLFSSLFPYSSTTANSLQEGLKSITGKEKTSLDNQTLLFKHFKGYLFSTPGLFTSENLRDTRKSLLIDSKDNESLATRIDEAKETWGDNNYFLQRLATRHPNALGEFSEVRYSASTAARADEQDSTKALVDLLISDDPIQAQLGADLVTYSYITASTQGATNFMKFIPTTYLNVNKVGEQLSEYNWGLGNPVGGFLRQYVQHNPSVTPKVPDDIKGSDSFNVPAIDDEMDTLYSEMLITSRIGEGKGKTHEKYPVYLHKRDKTANAYVLYERSSNEDQSYTYNRIDTLGEGAVMEFSREEARATSLIKSNQAPIQVVPFTNLPEASSEGSFPNGEANTNMAASYGLKSGSNKEAVIGAFEKISEDSDNRSHKAVAEILARSQHDLPALTFKTGDVGGKGVFNTKTFDSGRAERSITLNLEKIDNVNEFEKVLLHESIHAYTSSLLTTNEKNLTKAQRRAVKSIKVLRQVAKNNLSEKDKIAFKKFNTKFKAWKKADELGDTETRDNLTFRTAEFNKFYGLINDKEFVTMAMTEPEFQRILNNIQFSGDRSMFMRFQEIIAELIKGMQEALGIEVVSGSVLEQAVNDITDLISTRDSMLDGTTTDFNLNATEYSSNLPLTLNRKFRSEFGLLNSSGLNLKNMSKAAARKKAQELNGDNRFIRMYGDKYYARTTLVPGEPGDSNVYNQLHLVKKNTENNTSDFSINADPGVDPSIKTLIGRLETRIVAHKHAMKGSRGDDTVYKDKIDKLEAQIQTLNKDNNLKAMKAVADAHLTWVSNVLDGTMISPGEIQEAYGSLSVWLDLKEIFRDEYRDGGPFQVAIANIDTTADDLSDKLRRAQVNLVLRESKGVISRPLSKEHMEVMPDVGRATSLLLDSASVDSPFISFISTTLKESIRSTNYDFLEESKDTNKALQKFYDTAEFKSKGYDPFLQKDAKGNWTGGIVVEYSHSLVEARAKNRAILNASKKTSNDFNKYYAWIRANETIVDSRLVLTKTGELQTTPKAKAHKRILVKEFGEVKAQELIDEAQSLFMEYLKAKEAIIVEYTNNLLDPDYSQDDFNSDLSTWVLRNSPKTYLDSQEGSTFNTEARGGRFIATAPKKVNSKGKETGWYDKSYQKIEENPVLKEFYTFYMTKLQKMISNLPAHEADELGVTFLPDIKKSLLRTFTEDGMGAAMTNLSAGLLESLTSDLGGAVTQDRDMHTGKAAQRIGISYTKGNVNIGERSADLGRILEAFTMTSLNYKHKSKSEDLVLIMQRVLSETKEQKLNSKGGNAIDSKGILHQEREGLINIKAMVDHEIRATIYNDKREEGTATGAMLSTQGVKSTLRANKLSAQIRMLNTQATLNQITDVEHTERVAPLQEELDTLGARDVTTADIADTAMKLTQLKGMGYNTFASANNITLGLLSNITQAAGGEDFTMGELLSAFRIMLNSSAKSAGYANKTSLKVAALMEKFDVLFEVDEAAYNGDKKTKKKKKWGPQNFSTFEMQRRSEYFVQGQLMVARMLNMKVTTLEGVETSLFEAFDENGEWRADVYGPHKGWEGDINTKGDLKEFKILQNHLIGLNKVVHGNYDPASFPRMKRYVLGRFALQFKSWFAESVKRRYGKISYNEELRRHTKGFYVSIAENPLLFFKQALMQKDGLASLSEIDQANLKKGMFELVSLLTFSIMGLLLQQLADDDDEPTPELNMLLNLTSRMQDDLSFYINPSSFNRMLSNPIPAIRVYLDAQAAVKKTARFLMQGEDLDGRKEITGEDLGTVWAKSVPFANQAPKIIGQRERVF